MSSYIRLYIGLDGSPLTARLRRGLASPGETSADTSGAAMRIGLYPGTFDPITNGHLDVIERGLKLVDRLVVGVAINSGKGPMFSLNERVAMVNAEVAPFRGRAEILVEPFDTLLMHFAQKLGATIIVRGLRAVADFEYEYQMTAINQQLNREIETVFLMADLRHQAIASRLVKEIATLGGDISHFVTPRVRDALLAKVAARAG